MSPLKSLNIIILLTVITAAIGAIVTSDSHKVLSQPFNTFSPSMSVRPQHCYQEVDKCVALSSSQCLDVTLPYKFTSSNSFVSNYSMTDIHSYLSQWRGLRNIPQCWKALQSVLCASFFPRCDNDLNRVLMPTHEMCRFTRSPCRLIDLHYEWPEFLRCDNQMYFPPKCKNEYTDLKFNTSAVAKCAPPLVSSDDSNIWYPGIEGCALNCHNPIYTEEQHRKVSTFIYYLSVISLITTLYAVMTFIIDWRNSNRYPAVIIFYLNMCFLISNFGWILQSILPKGKTEIICRSDNTTRYGEPGTPENFYCLLVFFLIYYFSMAALVWFVNLAFAWDLSFQMSSSQRDSFNSKHAYFHMTAWSIPLILSITILALGEVDGDSVRGICFVGFLKPVMRICFVLVPTTVALIIGCFYMFKAMYTLIRVKIMNKSQTNANKSRSKRILNMIIRIALFVGFAIIAVICTYVCHIYEFTHLPLWKRSLNNYIICSLNIKPALYPTLDEITEEHSCKKEETPNLLYVYAELLSFFGASIMVSTWVWSNSLSCWKRFLIRQLKPELNEPIRIKRHELISKLFNRRNQLSQGCYSPSLQSMHMHDDPVGMNLNSAASQDLSATWAAALPNFVYRRGGITSINDTHYLPSFFGTRHSSTSDISQQRSFDSYASQRRSLDSQISLEHLELVAMTRHQRRKTKKERERLLKAHSNHRALPYNIPVRRGSDTSGSVISAAFAARGLPNVLKLETKSTSTGDLISLAQPQPQIPFLAPYLPPSSLSFHPQCSLPFIISKPVQRQRSSKPSFSNFTFTHGINDQSNHLVNPLIEKRRPDSCAPKIDNCVQNHQRVLESRANQSNVRGSQQTPQSFASANPLSNYSITYLNSVNYTTPSSSLNYYNPLNAYYAGLVPNNHQISSSFSGFPNFISPPQCTATPIPGMPFGQQFTYNGLSPAYNPVAQQCANLHEIQSLIREREKYLSLTVPMDSSSEVGDNFFPIQLSDSEGLYSDRFSRNEEIATAQRIVDEHMQKVEAAFEANKNKSQSVVGDIGESEIGSLLEVKKSKSSNKSEKRKKKKSSHRKHKSSTSTTNGHLVNDSLDPTNDIKINCVSDNNININETCFSKQESAEDVIR